MCIIKASIVQNKTNIVKFKKDGSVSVSRLELKMVKTVYALLWAFMVNSTPTITFKGIEI